MDAQQTVKGLGNAVLQIVTGDGVGGSQAGGASVGHGNAHSGPFQHIGVVVRIAKGADGFPGNAQMRCQKGKPPMFSTGFVGNLDEMGHGAGDVHPGKGR